MKKILILLLLVVAGVFAWQNRGIFGRYVNKNLTDETRTIGLAEKAARKEKARVTETKAVESASSEESVRDGMSADEVRAQLGDPTSIEPDAGNGVETWHYEAICKKVIFRGGKVWTVEAN
jgi:hypothetical protein